MGGPRAAPGYGRRARGDPDASGSIRGCTPPAAATQIRNKTKVGNLIRAAQFDSGTVGTNYFCTGTVLSLFLLFTTHFTYSLSYFSSETGHLAESNCVVDVAKIVTEVIVLLLWLL